MKIWWIHGYSRTSLDFETLRQLIPKSVESQSVTLPGHGDSLLPFAGNQLDPLLDHLNSLVHFKDIVVGHSLGARIALALKSPCKKIALSPPGVSEFTRESRRELLNFLDPRLVRGEAKPMTALKDWLSDLDCFQESNDAQLAVGEHDLAACKSFCGNRKTTVIPLVNHHSILTAPATQNWFLKETHGLLESN